MKKWLSLSLAAALLAAALSGCAKSPTVSISAAASLTDVMEELATAYQKEHSAVELVFSFDSSGTLQTQIEEGAPADLFLSAGKKQMDALEEQGLLAQDSRVNLLENKVVLIAPKDSAPEITSFEDVATDLVSMVAIGEESVPVGQYTQEIYESLGLWDAVSAKANFGSNVRTVLGWVEAGEVDCGIVYATDAAISQGVTVLCQAPAGTHKPIIYPSSVLKNAKQPQEAQAFLDYLQGEDAAAIFAKFGFAPVHK